MVESIAVWFSCGAASAVAAKMTLAKYGNSHDVRILNTPIAEEDADNRRFLNDVKDWLGVEIETVIHPDHPESSCEEVWESEQFMSSPYGAVCTRILKKEARQLWEVFNNPDHHVFGFTADEEARHDRFVKNERSNVLPILIERNVTKEDCAAMLINAGLNLPRMYSLGYPNANCVGCVKATSPTYWNKTRETHPEVFASRAKQSRSIGKNGAKLVRYKGKRIYLDELPVDAIGQPLKSLEMPECGLFCEEL